MTISDILFNLGQAIPTILAIFLIAKYRYSIPAFVSGVLAAIAFPPCEFSFLAWFALVPWLYSIPKLNIKQILMSNLIFDLTYFGIGISWMATVHFLSPIAILVPLYLIILPFPFLYYSFQKHFMPTWIAIPIAWVANDYLRCYIFTGFPWLYMGHTQAYQNTIIQFADITGAYGVTFLVVWINALFASWYSALKNKKINAHLYVGTTIAIGVLVLAYLYGTSQDHKFEEGPKVACIQGNIPQDIKDNVTELHEKVYTTYTQLSGEALKENVDMIIWPETMASGDANLTPATWQTFYDMTTKYNTNLLVGSHHYSLDYNKQTFFNNNSAYFFDRKGSTNGRYDKIRLVPVGESIPFSSYIPFVPALVYIMVGYVPDLKPGNERTVFELDGKYKFGSQVCFDIIYPDETRILAKNGCQFVVNVTNEGWFAHSSELEQITANAIFRAIENRIGILRSGNSGITLAIPPSGKLDPKYIFTQPIEEHWNSLPDYMQERLQNKKVINWHYFPEFLWNEKYPLISSVRESWDIKIDGKYLKWKDFPGFFVTKIPLKNKETFYTKYGDWLPQICCGICIILSLLLMYRLGIKKWPYQQY